jgi:hypothetical protein
VVRGTGQCSLHGGITDTARVRPQAGGGADLEIEADWRRSTLGLWGEVRPRAETLLRGAAWT